MQEYKIKPVGYVINDFNEPAGYNEIKKQESMIIIGEKYVEALLNIENCEYLDIVFYFHKADEFKLSGKTHSGEVRGVFASRSPRRPNSVGVTTVKLLGVEKNRLIVKGLDAINETPVIDIKSCDTSIFELEYESNPVHMSLLKTRPRIEINNFIEKTNLDALLLKAGQLHGHFCPGLAMGVMAAAFAMDELNEESDGMEDLLAITETNSCFADGVQFVTGCTFGNNSLIYKDIGKTAFTLTRRDGKGIRICSKNESRQLIQDAFPRFAEYYQKVVVEQNRKPGNVSTYKKLSVERAFGTLKIKFDKLFKVHHTDVKIPEYAKIDDSVLCIFCKESVMKSKTVERSGDYSCYSCSGFDYSKLDGNGINK
ncbi:MAG: tRNA (N6-threonylcarbamoyladenosine(37)-N6)-methyltransferase TrmO [Bacteroidales bacterium]